MKVRILDAEREHYEVLDDSYVQIQQGAILPEWKAEAAEGHRALVDVIGEKLNLAPQTPVVRESEIKDPVPVVPHRHVEYLTDLPDHTHPLPEHGHSLLPHNHEHEHERALRSEEIAARELGNLEHFAQGLQNELRGHSHPPTAHEHPHTHEDILKTVAGLSETVAETARGHSHAEILTDLSGTLAMVENLTARVTSHTHPASPLQSHTHNDLEALIRNEQEARIAGDEAPREIPKHSHPHTHEAENTALAERVKAESMALVNAALDRTNFGSLEEVQALSQRLATHQHPHVHEDFLNEVKALRDKYEAFVRHGHADITAAVEVLEKKLLVEANHVHDKAPAHEHPEFAELREGLSDLRATVISLGSLITEQSSQITSLETRGAEALAAAVRNIDVQIAALQSKGDYVTRDELTTRKARYNLLRESHEVTNGKNVVIVTLEEV